MSRATDTPSPETSSARSATTTKGGAAPQPGATIPSGKVVCPYCGSVNDRPHHDYDNAACPKCTMADTPATRQATRARLGPWFVRQNRNPAAPGMKFDTLMGLVTRGQVTAQSVVRGPTTGQFWRFAAQVKGLSREFGVCYNCATPIDKAATICPQCNRLQEPPANPDVLLENAPTAAAAPSPSPSPSLPATPVHREIKTPAPAPAPVPPANKPMFEPAAALAAVATAPAPSRAPGPAARPSRSESPSPSRELLAPPARRRTSQRRTRSPEGILSAEDLATAFQLDFTPTTGRRRIGVRRAALAVLLLAISGGALVLILNADYRDRARVWFSETSSSVRNAVTGRTETPVRAAGKTESVDSRPAAPATQPAPVESFEPLVPPAPRATDLIAAKPAPQVAAPATGPETKPSVAPSAQISIAPVPTTNKADAAPKSTAKEQPITKVTPAPIDAATASNQAISLWRQALDAEAHRDYAKAVEHYEQIKKLPRSTWPAGLEINLALAKKRVK